MYIISGKFKRKTLLSPKGDHVRPTQSKVRESVFNRIQFDIEGAYFLDLFAGSGIMGFEAISRGADLVTFVENHPLSINAIKQNCELLEVSHETRLLSKEVFSALKQLQEEGVQFDYIYADPPYDKGLGEAVLIALDSMNLLKKEGLFWLEEAKAHPKETCLKTLKLVREKRMGRTFLREYSRSNLSTKI